MHPYYSVEQQSEAPFETFREHLPNGGAGERIWFTEVAARMCSDFAGRLVENGEAGQARRADWLVNTLIRNARPEHVFYYEFLLREGRRPRARAKAATARYTSRAATPPSRTAHGSRRATSGAAAGARRAGSGEAFLASSAQATLTGGAEL